MALSYYYTFSAPKTVSASELESFLRTVDNAAKGMGFEPTVVINGVFTSSEQRQFARRITGGLLVTDPRLKGVTLVNKSQIWDYDPERGECRIIPEKGVLLVVTDQKGCETVFGFLWYPDVLLDANGRELVKSPQNGRWFYHDFVDTPDRRYRDLIRMFADAGYLESEKDEYATA